MHNFEFCGWLTLCKSCHSVRHLQLWQTIFNQPANHHWATPSAWIAKKHYLFGKKHYHKCNRLNKAAPFSVHGIRILISSGSRTNMAKKGITYCPTLLFSQSPLTVLNFSIWCWLAKIPLTKSFGKDVVPTRLTATRPDTASSDASCLDKYYGMHPGLLRQYYRAKNQPWYHSSWLERNTLWGDTSAPHGWLAGFWNMLRTSHTPTTWADRYG